MIGTLFARDWKANGKLLLLFAAVLTLYGSLVTAMFDPGLGESLRQMEQSMPELFAAFGMENPGETLTGFLANYLYGFILLAFPMVFLVIAANRLVARYVDRGSMAYLLASPHSRSAIVMTQAAALLAFTLALAAFVALLVTLVSRALFPGALELDRFLPLNAGWCCLLIFLGGVCFLASCAFSDTRYTYGFGAGACILSLLIQMLSQTGGRLEVLKYLTPLTLFSPDGLIVGEGAAFAGSGILLAAGLSLYAAGCVLFCRRDLSL